MLFVFLMLFQQMSERFQFYFFCLRKYLASEGGRRLKVALYICDMLIWWRYFVLWAASLERNVIYGR